MESIAYLFAHSLSRSGSGGFSARRTASSRALKFCKADGLSAGGWLRSVSTQLLHSFVNNVLQSGSEGCVIAGQGKEAQPGAMLRGDSNQASSHPSVFLADNGQHVFKGEKPAGLLLIVQLHQLRVKVGLNGAGFVECEVGTVFFNEPFRDVSYVLCVVAVTVTD
ncbi:hypothetical protein [Nissabacter sp. SGAir0207]|uniref:hypothetical protein n=1 Tax=Nissabacter sp. SGAir0207 TaxID=2126321 RepID=UPI001F0F06E4|nr:hypothetical protein [Nissabacter sp. SGAir0207]